MARLKPQRSPARRNAAAERSDERMTVERIEPAAHGGRRATAVLGEGAALLLLVMRGCLKSVPPAARFDCRGAHVLRGQLRIAVAQLRDPRQHIDRAAGGLPESRSGAIAAA